MLTKAVAAMETVGASQFEEMSLLQNATTLHSVLAIEGLIMLRQQLANYLHKKLNDNFLATAKLSDLFFVLGALWHYQPALVSGEHLALAIKRLKTADTAIGGPYSDGSDDIITNVSIAIFMRIAAKPLPNVDEMLANYIGSEQFNNPGLNEPLLLYLLDAAGHRTALRPYLLKRLGQSDWGSPAEIATALTVLGQNTPKSGLAATLDRLSQLQKANGFWSDRTPGQISANKNSGVDVITTALVIESLRANGQLVTKSLRDNCRLHQLICDEAARTLGEYSEPISIPALDIIKKIRSSTKSFEITLFARFFANSLAPDPSLPQQAFFNLGLASLYGWLAYAIYDDLLDGEGTPAHLPLAHIALRLCLASFRLGSPNQRFNTCVTDTFDAMDEANAWEMQHCRFSVQNGLITLTELPKYNKSGDQLAARSFGHALGPMAIVMSVGTAKQIQHAKIGLRHYLVARQLNDDMPDWPDDLQAGRISYVVAALLHDARLQPGHYDISTLLPELQKCYRRNTQSRICRQILRSTKLAKQAFAAAGITHASNPIFDLLNSFERSASLALDMQTKSQAFAKAIERPT